MYVCVVLSHSPLLLSRLIAMDVHEVLQGVAIERLDAELLLAHVLEKDRAWLLAHGETALTEEQKKEFDSRVDRRKEHEPLAYILGEKEFYGRSFIVDRRVLIPRPSTEALIDEVKFLFANRFKINDIRMIEADSEIEILTWIKPEFSILPFDRLRVFDNSQFSIIDVGTGSGCIAITLAKEIPNVKIIATDISREALEVAKENAKRLGVIDRIECMEANGIPSNFQTSEPLPAVAPRGAKAGQNFKTSPYLLVSNPPYIPEGSSLPPDVANYEPTGALFAGSDGMDILAPLILKAKNDHLCIGFSMEMQQEQAKKLMTTL